MLCEDKDKDLINNIQEMEILMVVASANVRLDNIEAAHEIIDRVGELLDMATNCVDC